MDYKNLAYAKLNLPYDKEKFIKEYDELVYPIGIPIASGCNTVEQTRKLNDIWGMVDPDIYIDTDCFIQEEGKPTTSMVKKNHHQWTMASLLEIDITNIDDPILTRMAKVGGPSVRNTAIDRKLPFVVKKRFIGSALWDFIQALPIYDIIDARCVTLEPGDLATIHRDGKGLYTDKSSAGVNKVYQNGYVVLCLNITNGGVPLYWAFDNPNMDKFNLIDDDAYLSNDYFFHGVPMVTSRRRQLRITARPKPEFSELVDMSTLMVIPDNYQFDPGPPNV